MNATSPWRDGHALDGARVGDGWAPDGAVVCPRAGHSLTQSTLPLGGKAPFQRGGEGDSARPPGDSMVSSAKAHHSLRCDALAAWVLRTRPAGPTDSHFDRGRAAPTALGKKAGRGV